VIFHLITDATFLICLDNINNLNLISMMLNKGYYFIITAKVMEEITNIDEIIKKIGIHNNLFIGIIPDDEIFKRIDNRYPELGDGEKSVISVYLENKYNPCCALLDDKKADKIAKSLKMSSHGTIWFIEECFNRNIITKGEALNVLKNIEILHFG